MTAKKLLRELNDEIGYIYNDFDGLEDWYESERKKNKDSITVIMKPTAYATGYAHGILFQQIKDKIFTQEELFNACKELLKEENNGFYGIIEQFLEKSVEPEAISWRGYEKDLEVLNNVKS